MVLWGVLQALQERCPLRCHHPLVGVKMGSCRAFLGLCGVFVRVWVGVQRVPWCVRAVYQVALQRALL